MNRGVYVHVPFCEKRCYYCDFNTYTLERGDVDAYLKALGREIDLYRRRLADDPPVFTSLFIGGGTPTVLAPDQLKGLVDQLVGSFELVDGAELTCEANPGSADALKYAALAEAGVNRLSMGVQSLDDDLLRRIGRVHTAREAMASFEAAREAGFTNINVDLMFGLPGQSPGQWQDTLGRVMELGPEHISCYSLIIEEGTPFGRAHAKGELPLPSEDEELAMYEWAIDALQAAGYVHYEISNFARPGRESRHNTLYWRIHPYLGLGPGAHGYWDDVRYSNVRLPKEYAARLDVGTFPIATTESVDVDECMDDCMIFGLRLLDGVDRREFRLRFGMDITDVYGPQIEQLQGEGLIEVTAERVRLSRVGLPVGNRVFEAFLRVG